jgi:hypothetical protein
VVYELLCIGCWQERFAGIKIDFCDVVVALQRFRRASYTSHRRHRSKGLRTYEHKDSVIHLYIYELMELFNFIYTRGARLLTNIPPQHFLA